MIVGIDPGLTGGIAVLDNSNRLVILEALPVVAGLLDVRALAGRLRLCHDPLNEPDVYLELVGAMPKQGVSSTFKFGRTFGTIEGIVGALGFPLHLIRPKEWQKVSHLGTPGGADPKERSILAASRLYPTADLVRGTTTTRERASKPHLGLVDALLIAHYGWATLYGGRNGNDRT